MEIESMSLKELRQLKAKVERAISSYEDRRRRDAVAAAEEAAKAHGFNLSDLTKKSQKSRSEVAPKYAHPDNPTLTWSGRGRKPKWLAEAMDQGKPLEEFQV